ncbi:MAG: NAD(P)-binding domain-containing protein [Vicinamibacterales bacterium]
MVRGLFDVSPEAVAALAAEGSTATSSLEAFTWPPCGPPRAAWLMVPAHSSTPRSRRALSALLQADDVVIDGGNSRYTDDIRRSAADRPRHPLPGRRHERRRVGLERGYCLMIGGDRAAGRGWIGLRGAGPRARAESHAPRP